MPPIKVVLFANTDWYLYNFRLPLARRLRALGAEILLLSPDGSYGPRLRAEGFRWIPVPMLRRSLDPLRELRLVRYLIRLFRRERPDIVHSFTIKCVVYGSLAARMAGIERRVNAVAGMGHVFSGDGWRSAFLRPVVRWLMKAALAGERSRLILQNEDDRASFCRAGLIHPRHVRLIRGSGVDTARFRPGKAPAQQRRPFRVLFAARLLRDKGIEELVDAARQLIGTGMEIELLVAGAPDPGNPSAVRPDALQAWRNERGLKLLGHVENMEHWLREVDVAVLPSYREGAPRSLLEAAACGLALVATDVPGCREVVENGVNGILVPPRDADALATAIRWLRENPDARFRMGAAGREKVVKEFAEPLVLERTLDVYRELMPGRLS